MLSQFEGVLRACALLALFAVVPSPSAAAAPDGSISGVVVDAETSLPLAGARVSVNAESIGVAASPAGTFVLSVAPGVYRLRVVRDAYVTTDADRVIVAPGSDVHVTLAVRRAPTTGALQTIGTTATRTDRALQSSTTITRTLNAESLARGGDLRAADALRRLPGVNNGITGDTAALSDDVNLSLRGIGTLETVTLLDGHPIALGFPGGYNAQLSPLAGLGDIVVTYGSGSNLGGTGRDRRVGRLPDDRPDA